MEPRDCEEDCDCEVGVFGCGFVGTEGASWCGLLGLFFKLDSFCRIFSLFLEGSTDTGCTGPEDRVLDEGVGEGGVGEGPPLELGRDEVDSKELLISEGVRREFESLDDKLVLKCGTGSSTWLPELPLRDVTFVKGVACTDGAV